jgi:hypothetical protein
LDLKIIWSSDTYQLLGVKTSHKYLGTLTVPMALSFTQVFEDTYSTNGLEFHTSVWGLLPMAWSFTQVFGSTSTNSL